MIIVLFGKPGAGKGTQAPLLAAALGVPTLATGDVLRAASRDGTPLGLEAKAYMDRGDLVPDAVILGIIKEALASRGTRKRRDPRRRRAHGAAGRRTGARCSAELGRKVDAVLCFDVDDDELVQRLSGRTVCEKCQTPYTGREPGTDVRQVRRHARAPQGRRAGGDPQPARGLRRADGAGARLVQRARHEASPSIDAVGIGGRRHGARARRLALGSET